MTTTRSPRILVGVDGSPRSVAALRWALEHARCTGSPVDVVSAWEPGLSGATGPIAAGVGAGATAAVALLSTEELDGALAAEAHEVAGRSLLLADADAAAVPVRPWALRGRPGPLLCDLARPEDLLVVGPSGHGPLVGTLLGSVATYLVAHAPCSVVVVRDPEASA